MKPRLLHPSFFTDEKVRQLSPNAKLLLQGLWLRADDHGKAVYLPKLIEGEVFPTEQVDIYSLLNEVIGLRLIRVYEVGGQTYYDTPSWERWQNPKYKAISKLPDYPGKVGDDLEKDLDNSVPIEGQNGEKGSDRLGLGLEFKKGLEDVSPPSRENFRQFWQRKQGEQRREAT